MDRCKVICHMMVSIDGKIDGAYMEASLSEAPGRYYEKIVFELGDALANGTNTNLLYDAYAEVDYGKYANAVVLEGDSGEKQPGESYLFSFDRHGRCNWDRNWFEYGDKRSRIVEVLTGQVGKAYRAHLNALGIPYLIAGETEMNMELALEKIKERFGVETLVLCGGSRINGAFFAADVVDEISLVMAPYVEGDPEKKAFADTDGMFCPTAFALKAAKPLPDGGVHLTFCKRAI